MKKLIRKILREHKSDRHYKILDKITEHVQLPYFESMEGLTIYDEDDQEYIMKKILGNIYIKRYYIYDDRGNRIYWEVSDGWVKYEYDDKGNLIYHENSDGDWWKWEYDDKGNRIYYEDSDGWRKYEYDDKGNKIYYEDSHGYIEDIR
jgi:YD repeat-containing protein